MVGNAKRMRQHFGNHDPDWEQSPGAPNYPRITNFTVYTSKADQDKFDLNEANFFANNLTFRAVESREFRELCQALHPEYKPPTRKRLAGDPLEAGYSDLKKKIFGKR